MRLIIKTYSIACILLTINPVISLACNGGCPSGGGYLGIVPQFNKNFAGIRYRMRSFSFSNTLSDYDSKTKHHFETAEIWGRFYPSRKIQAFVFVPFQMNSEKSSELNYTQGVGDISFIFNYNIINTGDSLDKEWKHNLLLGAGLKLPTGKYQKRNISRQMFPITFQPGTGAYSAIAGLIYTVRHNKTGINTNLSYYYNGKNELEYSFGNMFTFNSSLFYWFNAGKVSFLPNAGTYIEQTARDIDNGYYVKLTGGTIGYGSIGLDVYINRLALGVSVQKPYFQRLPQRVQENDLRILASTAWLF